MSTIPGFYRYIVRSPGVRGGIVRVEGTRIGVHDVVGLLQNGETVDSITSTCFPTLTKAHVYACLAYYEDHKGEIDLLIARQMSDALPYGSAGTRPRKRTNLGRTCDGLP